MDHECDGLINSQEELASVLGQEPATWAYEQTETKVGVINDFHFYSLKISPIYEDMVWLDLGGVTLSYPFRLDDFKSLVKRADLRALEVRRLIKKYDRDWLDHDTGSFEAEMPKVCRDKQTGRFTVTLFTEDSRIDYSKHDDELEAELYQCALQTRLLDLKGVKLEDIGEDDSDWERAIKDLYDNYQLEVLIKG